MKSVFVFSLLISCVCVLYSAGFDENFKRKSFQLSSQSCLYNNWGRSLDTDAEYNHTILSIYPSFDYFIVDQLSIGIFTGLSWNDYESKSGCYTENCLDLTVGLNGEYYISSMPIGPFITPSLGTSIVFSYSPPSEGQSYINLSLFPHAQFNYFVNKNIALFIKAGINTSFLLYKNGKSELENITDELEFSAGVVGGFSYYFPSDRKTKQKPINHRS
jgi:hypothetical protein